MQKYTKQNKHKHMKIYNNIQKMSKPIQTCKHMQTYTNKIYTHKYTNIYKKSAKI